MNRQLDILAIEPFFGGVRRNMLDAMVRCSRHRWTVLKLPPRRVERRLTSAARWFAELLSRRPLKGVDVVFASEAIALTDLFHYVPLLRDVPSVAYFHNNQLPDPDDATPGELDCINIQTAAVATQVWFNSMFHLKSFLAKAAAVVKRSPELGGHNPIPDLMPKLHVVPPPLDLALIQRVAATQKADRHRNRIFADTRGGEVGLLSEAVRRLLKQGHKIELVTVGRGEIPADGLSQRTIPESDEIAQVQAMRQSGAMVSTRVGSLCDQQTVWGMSVGCWPIVPRTGFYPELVPEALHDECLYDDTPETLADRLAEYWSDKSRDLGPHAARSLQSFDALTACRDIDFRLERLARPRPTLAGIVGTLRLDASPVEVHA